MRKLFNIVKYSTWLLRLAYIMSMCLIATNIYDYTNVSYWILAIPLYITFGTPFGIWLIAFVVFYFNNLVGIYSYNQALRLEKKIKRELDSIEEGINRLKNG